MIHLADIHPLTEFQRHTRRHLERLKKTGRPEVLTINGRAELVVQDAASYQALVDLVERCATLEAIRRALESVERGEDRPAEEVLEEIRQKYRIPPPA